MPLKILMPALSPTMNEGNLVKWHIKEGETVKAGQTLAEIETDKATMEVEAVDEGILGRILVPEGTENVKVNALIGLILEEGEDPSTLDSMIEKSTSPQEIPSQATPSTVDIPSSKSLPAATVIDTLSTTPKELTFPAPSSEVDLSVQSSFSINSVKRPFSSPLARRLAQQQGIDLQEVQGSGPRGRIVKADIEGYIPPQNMVTFSSNAPSSTSNAKDSISRPSDGFLPAYREIKVGNIRKVIAGRLSESKQRVPHFYLSVDCEIDGLLTARQNINSQREKQDKISLNDFIIKTVAMALKKVPDANVAWADSHLKHFDQTDISVAVAADSGLITPIIRSASEKSLGDISAEMKSLIAKAREGKLKTQEFQGGTFSLSNLGMYGIRDFSAIINPPQACILAIGVGEQRPVVKDGQLAVATVMSCTLSVDHRCVDGAVAAQFLQCFKQMITQPVLMLV